MKSPRVFGGFSFRIKATANYFGNAVEGYTPLGEYYYSAAPCERSEALAEYGYNELCLALDCLYGLKEIHDISYFDQGVDPDIYLANISSFYDREKLTAYINQLI